MTPAQALSEVCREFCGTPLPGGMHDDACTLLRGIVSEWGARHAVFEVDGRPIVTATHASAGVREDNPWEARKWLSGDDA